MKNEHDMGCICEYCMMIRDARKEGRAREAMGQLEAMNLDEKLRAELRDALFSYVNASSGAPTLADQSLGSLVDGLTSPKHPIRYYVEDAADDLRRAAEELEKQVQTNLQDASAEIERLRAESKRERSLRASETNALLERNGELSRLLWALVDELDEERGEEIKRFLRGDGDVDDNEND